MKLIDIIFESVVDLNEMPARLTRDEFITKAQKKHHNEDGTPKYTYDKVDYKNNRLDVMITCPKHGDFPQTPSSHLHGRGCYQCNERKRGNQFMKRDEFIQRAKDVHGDKYGYDNVVMGKGVYKDRVLITCPKHGDFPQTPWNHIGGAGCPVCLEPRGESKIRNILKSMNVDFSKEHVFDDCVNTNNGEKRCKKLQFDFYFPSKNIAIEYDGIHHFKPVKRFGGIERFNTQKINDKIKDEYCEKMGIKLVRIPYTEFKNLEEILKTLLV
jgi:hypothetical protein